MPRRLRPSYALPVLLVLAPGLVLGGLTVADRPASAADAVPTRHGVRLALAGVPARAALNRSVEVTGTALDPVTGRPLPGVRVVLEVRTRRGWDAPPATPAVSDSRGGFTIDAPTYYYGRHVFRARVAGPASRSQAALTPSVERAVTVPLPYRPAGRASSGRLSGARFDPCHPIPFRINYAGAPRNARRLVVDALAKARAATGLTFTYAGRYSGTPFSRQRGGGLPSEGIGFAWATPRQVPGLAGATIGLGGGGWAVNGRRMSSGVVIDRTFRFRSGWTRPNSIGSLLLHELGHALGLEHVKDRSQQMYPLDVGAPNGNYNRGDLAALRKVGLDAGCL